MELVNKYYYFVNERAQSLFLFWVKYGKPPLSKDLVRYIATNFFKVWVNPYKRLVELAVPHYGEHSVAVVTEYFKRAMKLRFPLDFLKSITMLRMLECENFLGVEDWETLKYPRMKRCVFPNVVLSNLPIGRLWIVERDFDSGKSFELDSPEVAKFLKEEK